MAEHVTGNIQRAKELHALHPVILIHDHEPPCDDIGRCMAGGVSGKVYLPVLDIKIQPDPLTTGLITEGWAKHALARFGEARREIEQTDGRTFVTTSADGFRRAHAERRVAVLLGSEGGKLIEGSLDLLSAFHGLGYRFMQLTWAYPNQISNVDRQPDPGLTSFGRELIPELNKLGILIDIGHAGRHTFFQTLELSEHPIIVSHTGVKGAIRSSRHPDWQVGPDSFCDDDMLKALAQNKGVFGIHFFGPLYFRKENGFCDITLDDVIPHLEYAAELVGPDVLALGCDFFPTYGDWAGLMRAQGHPPDHFVTPKERLYEFTAALLDRGWSETEVSKVLGGNFLRVCREVLGA